MYRKMNLNVAVERRDEYVCQLSCWRDSSYDESVVL